MTGFHLMIDDGTPDGVPLEEAILFFKQMLGKTGEVGGVYATLALDEARAMGSLTADEWHSKTRAARAHKVALIIAERRMDFYFSLKAESEIKNMRDG